MLLSTLCARNVPTPQNNPRSSHGGLLLRLAVPLSTGGPAGSFEREGEERPVAGGRSGKRRPAAAVARPGTAASDAAHRPRGVATAPARHGVAFPQA